MSKNAVRFLCFIMTKLLEHRKNESCTRSEDFYNVPIQKEEMYTDSVIVACTHMDCFRFEMKVFLFSALCTFHSAFWILNFYL